MISNMKYQHMTQSKLQIYKMKHQILKSLAKTWGHINTFFFFFSCTRIHLQWQALADVCLQLMEIMKLTKIQCKCKLHLWDQNITLSVQKKTYEHYFSRSQKMVLCDWAWTTYLENAFEIWEILNISCNCIPRNSEHHTKTMNTLS